MIISDGQQIGAYRVIRLLGRGGMGAVYEVEHAQLGVHYALKTFALESGHVDLLKNKFLAEGKILARLHDPHLVRVFDLNFDERSGMPYFVMDLVLSDDGTSRTLADVRTEDLDEDRILRWFTDLATALDYIHGQGIVHRDIKLGNVLLAADGHVVLSDFGISRLFSDRLRSDVNAVNTMVSEVRTGTRLVMGTQGYMAPEVADGQAATPAADVYSLGVMFVYLLTGIWYEPGSKVFKLLEALEYRWIDVLPRLLSVNPNERPTNLTELVGTLRNAPTTDVSPNGRARTPVAPLRVRRFALIAGVLIVSVVLAVVASLIFVTRSAGTAGMDDIDDAFSARGIYEGPHK